jgi:hypothetical protein
MDTEFTIEIPKQVLEDEPEMAEYLKALQLMVNRMVFSHFKYGAMSNKYPDSASAFAGAQKRLAMYENSGNTEDCLDAANFAVIEHLFPSHPKAHFRAQTSAESPGVPWQR